MEKINNYGIKPHTPLKRGNLCHMHALILSKANQLNSMTRN